FWVYLYYTILSNFWGTVQNKLTVIFRFLRACFREVFSFTKKQELCPIFTQQIIPQNPEKIKY
ncbi:MAG: hypothetical protein LUC50_04610, partial [Ruminococcus sp.]|nr:hypothetical protein [Ruminococcus sp.]